MTRFSVVIPVYCTEQYLAKCIESVLTQGYENLEVILVDDGSPDGSPQICDHYAAIDSRVKVIHQHNAGVVRARQVGAQMASGEYIACVDSDDFISEDYFSAFDAVIQEFHPDIVMCGHYRGYGSAWDSEFCDMEEGFYPKSRIRERIFPQLICDSRGRQIPQVLWGKVFRASLYRECQLADTYVTMGEDSACVIPAVFRSNSFYMLRRPMYYYRQNPDSVCNAKKVFPWDGPMLRVEHITNLVDLQTGNLREQFNRMIVLSVFTVVASRYHSDVPTKIVNKEICDYLDNPIIQDAISGCHFDIRKINLWVRLFALRYRWLFVIRAFNKRSSFMQKQLSCRTK